MRRIAFGIVGLFGLALAARAQDDKEKAKEAEEKIKAFKAEVAKAKSEGDTANAINNHLGDLQHPKILAELKIWLVKQWWEVTEACAQIMTKYTGDKGAAEALFKFGLAQLSLKDKSLAADRASKLIDYSAKVGSKEMAKSYTGLFKHSINEVALAGIQACGEVKSKDGITPLINLVRELEGIRDDNAGGSNTGGMKDKDGNPLPNTPNQADKERERKQKLLPAALSALRDITGESYKTAKEWDAWAKKNLATFKEQGGKP